MAGVRARKGSDTKLPQADGQKRISSASHPGGEVQGLGLGIRV